MIIPSGPDDEPNYGEVIWSKLDELEAPRTVRSCFPYMDQQGLNRYCLNNEGADWREPVTSKWLIGLNQGTTHPDALRELTAIDKTTVKVFLPHGRITASALSRHPYIHAKAVFLSSDDTPEQNYIIVTSANATRAALGPSVSNFELGIVNSAVEDLSTEDRTEFNDWWKRIWEQGRELTEELVEDYAEVREEFSGDRSPDTEVEAITTITSIDDAKCLWFYSGAMSSGYGRYERDVRESDDLARFFEEFETAQENPDNEANIRMRYDSYPFDSNCKAVYRPSQHYSPQLRIHLPRNFPEHDDEFYPKKYIKIEKVYDDSGVFYQVEVKSDDPTEWRRKSEEFGRHLPEGRSYEEGYY